MEYKWEKDKVEPKEMHTDLGMSTEVALCEIQYDIKDEKGRAVGRGAVVKMTCNSLWSNGVITYSNPVWSLTSQVTRNYRCYGALTKIIKLKATNFEDAIKEAEGHLSRLEKTTRKSIAKRLEKVGRL